MCVSCGELITITDIYPDGECGYYYVELTVPQAAVTLSTDNGSIQNNGSGLYLLYDIPCGESVTIQLINDQACVSASKTITFDCCPTTPCIEQTLTIDATECVGGRFSITAEDFSTCFNLAPWDIELPSNTSAWGTLAATLELAINNCVELDCCTGYVPKVRAEIIGNFVTLIITDSPITFTSITISGGSCNNNVINFDHTNC